MSPKIDSVWEQLTLDGRAVTVVYYDDGSVRVLDDGSDDMWPED